MNHIKIFQTVIEEVIEEWNRLFFLNSFLEVSGGLDYKNNRWHTPVTYRVGYK